MKKIIAIISCLLPLFLFGACTPNTESYSSVYNYMQSLSLLSCGVFYVKIGERVPCVLDKDGNGFTVMRNAVELSEAGIVRVLYSDSNSFYYATVEMADSYGNGNGYRIYRYYLKTGKEKLIYSDVSVTNFDSILGLEDVFNFSAPTSGHGLSHSSLFYINGDTVMPDYKIKKVIAQAIENEKSEIELSSISFKFAVTNKKVLFTDALGKLWVYSPQTRKITQFCTQTVSDFFVTENKVFAFSVDAEEIKVFDVYANEIKSIDIKGVSFPQNSLQLSGDECFLRDDDGRIWYIDENADMTVTLFKASGLWCVNGSKMVLYDDSLELLNIKSGLHKQHDFKAMKTIKPTCKRKGKIVYVCVCGKRYEEITPKLPHTKDQRKYCTDEVICLKCKVVLEPPKKHEMSLVGTYNNDATCEKNGTQAFTCKNCPYTETKEAENTALGHEDDDGDNLCDRCGIEIKKEKLGGIIELLSELFSK